METRPRLKSEIFLDNLSKARVTFGLSSSVDSKRLALNTILQSSTGITGRFDFI